MDLFGLLERKISTVPLYRPEAGLADALLFRQASERRRLWVWIQNTHGTLRVIRGSEV